MPEWLKSVIAAATLAAVVTFGIVLSYNDGVQDTSIGNLQKDIADVAGKIDTQTAELTNQIDDGVSDLSDQIEKLTITLRAQEIDYTRFLVGMGVASTEDVYVAAVVDGWVWLVPSPGMEASLGEKGFATEQITPFLSGVRVIEAASLIEN